MVINQYQIYWVNLDPTIGKEIQKTRPCVVISPDQINHNIDTIIIAPITSTLKKYPSRVPCIVAGKKGTIMLEQIRSVDKQRLGNLIGSLNKDEIKMLKQVINELLVL